VSRFRVDDVTAEPRMEDLLASIRKAIHEDIGDMPAAPRLHAPAPTQTHYPAPRVGDELAAAASDEIQQLREKISRARAGKPVPPVEPAQRAASLAAALQNDIPRRNWRELEPAPLPPKLRGSVIEPEPSRPLPRVEIAAPRLPLRDEMPARSEVPSMLSGESAQAVNAAFGKLANCCG